jgi:hypothetical protein
MHRLSDHHSRPLARQSAVCQIDGDDAEAISRGRTAIETIEIPEGSRKAQNRSFCGAEYR